MNLRSSLIHYFQLERLWTIGLSLFGFAALALAVYLWLAKGSFRAAALPLGLCALFELGAGLGVALRTPSQVSALLVQLESGQDMAAERARMERVAHTFEIVKLVELALILVGVGLVYARRASDFSFAVGVGLIAQCSLLLVFDLIAERRAELYLTALHAP
jgi:hypothetical protein